MHPFFWKRTDCLNYKIIYIFICIMLHIEKNMYIYHVPKNIITVTQYVLTTFSVLRSFMSTILEKRFETISLKLRNWSTVSVLLSWRSSMTGRWYMTWQTLHAWISFGRRFSWLSCVIKSSFMHWDTWGKSLFFPRIFLCVQYLLALVLSLVFLVQTFERAMEKSDHR